VQCYSEVGLLADRKPKKGESPQSFLVGLKRIKELVDKTPLGVADESLKKLEEHNHVSRRVKRLAFMAPITIPDKSLADILLFLRGITPVFVGLARRINHFDVGQVETGEVDRNRLRHLNPLGCAIL
jgi:hypothetical protein